MLEKINTKNAAISVIRVPIELEIPVLQNMLNEAIGRTIYQGDTKTKPNFKVQVDRTDDIQLTCLDEVLSYKLPLEIIVSKGKLKAVATLLMSFETEVLIQENWEIKTRTRLHQHRWISKPRFHVGFMKIPIQLVLDNILQLTKSRLEDQIDEVFRQKIQFKTKIEELWNITQQSLRLHQEYPIYLSADTQKIHFKPFQTDDSTLKFGLSLSVATQLYIGDFKKLSYQSPLPNIQFEVFDTSTSTINLTTNVSYDVLNKYGMEYLKGREFDLKGQKIEVNKLQIKSINNNLNIELEIIGDLNGTVFLNGTPTINYQKNRLSVDDLSFDFKTENLLHKTAAWLIKGEVLKIIQKNLDVPLDEKLILLQNMINMQLYQIASGIQIVQAKSTIKKLSVDHLLVEPGAIKMDWEALTDLSVQLKS